MFYISLLCFVVLSVLYALRKVTPTIYRGLTSPLRRLPGPPSDSFLFGNFKRVIQGEGNILKKWSEEYGDTLAFPDLFCVSSAPAVVPYA